MNTLKIIWEQKVDLILFVVLISLLIWGIATEDYVKLGGGLLIAIGNKVFEFKEKIKLIKLGYFNWLIDKEEEEEE